MRPYKQDLNNGLLLLLCDSKAFTFAACNLKFVAAQRAKLAGDRSIEPGTFCVFFVKVLGIFRVSPVNRSAAAIGKAQGIIPNRLEVALISKLLLTRRLIEMIQLSIVSVAYAAEEKQLIKL